MKKFLLSLIAVAAVFFTAQLERSSALGLLSSLLWPPRLLASWLLVCRVLAPRLLVPWSSHGCCGPGLICLHVKETKPQEFVNIVKAGRTHLQDATQLTVGQEISVGPR